MIRIPQNIQSLRAYKSGKTISQIIDEFSLTQTAILWNNENSFGCSPKAIVKMREVLNDLNLYPDPQSTSLCAKIAEVNHIKPTQVVIGNGSEGLLQNIIRAFCQGKDEVLTFQGTFVIIYVWSQLNDTLCKKIPLTNTYDFDLQSMLKQMTKNTKIIYLSNPNNPTGAMISDENLRSFMTQVPKDVLVVLDEAYYEYAREISEIYPNSISLNYPNMLTIRTFSKVYGLAGIRVGYAMGPENLISTLMRVKLTFEPSVIAQAAGEGAIDDDAFLQKTVVNNRKQLKLFYKVFDRLNISYVPSFANFVMIDMGKPEIAQELFEKLLHKGVFVRLIAAFGLPHCIRITIGTPEENQFFLTALESIIIPRD
jgi:histidinol-phosphate aminotransferase